MGCDHIVPGALSLHPFRATVTLLVLAFSLIQVSPGGRGISLSGQDRRFRRNVFSRNVFVAFSFEPYLIPKPSEEKHGSR